MLNLGPREGANDSASEVVDSVQPDNLKRRRLDLGDLMVKPAQAKLIPVKPAELFRQVKQSEITRLAESDPMPPANKSLGRGAGKDGRPTVTALIKARVAEAAFRASLSRELAEERKRFEDFRRDETLRKCNLWRMCCSQ